MKFSCPSCGAPSQFSSDLSLYFTCPFCRTQIFKSEEQIESLGKVADLPEDMSPLQLYSEGEYRGKKFKIVGRIKLSWEDGYWNEWALHFSDGKQAWLAEAQGEFIVSWPITDIKVPDISSQLVGQSIEYHSQRFTFADFKKAKSYGFEGELPFKTVLDEERLSIDLLAVSSTKFLTFEIDASGERAFLGEYMSLADLKMTNLRKFHGWNA